MKPAAVILALSSLLLGSRAAEPNTPVNPTDSTAAKSTAAPAPATPTERATFGGGCFWCTEAVFEMLEGVKSVTSGYAGGTTENPTYKAVCSGETGHAEVIQVEYDPARIRYGDLLEAFWDAHDPTTLNRQGPDSGTQYRSVIFYHDDVQRQAAEKSKAAAAARFNRPIVTEIKPLTKFYPAEAYHQDFFRNNQNYPYCAVNIRPKVEKFKKKLGSQTQGNSTTR